MVCRIGADPVFFAARDFAFRRLAREAEGAPLLREYGVKSSIEGSNPSVSASSGEIARKARHPDDFR